MNKLADQNLAERKPSRIVEVLFHSHPPIAKRICRAPKLDQAQTERQHVVPLQPTPAA